VAVALAAAGAWMSPLHRWISPAVRVANAEYLQAQESLDSYYKPGHIEKSIALFQKAAASDPKSALAWAGLARAYWRSYVDTRDTTFIPKAKDACGKALELGGNIASVHVTLGMIYTDGGHSDLATQELDQALRLDQRNAEAYAAFADLYKMEGRDADVEPARQKAIDLSPSDWRWPNQLALFYRSIGKFADAERLLQQSAALSPDNPRPLINLEVIFHDDGRLTDARAAIERSIAILPDYSSYSNLGNILLEQGEYNRAAAMYRRSIELGPASYLAHANLASALLWGPDGIDKARPEFQKAIELAEVYRKDRPRDAEVTANLGSYYASLGDAAKSIPLVKQALSLEPENPGVLFRAAESFEILHDRDQALHWIRKAVDRGFSLGYINRSPELAGLRSDPRFFSIANRKK
jgi:tetratricopeptide (TPR) repeat protein